VKVASKSGEKTNIFFYKTAVTAGLLVNKNQNFQR
jgi:sulfur relay (sulfurtransferase) complex TusBCD TusD component (DsrE family)